MDLDSRVRTTEIQIWILLFCGFYNVKNPDFFLNFFAYYVHFNNSVKVVILK
jgi:hypothetical protein